MTNRPAHSALIAAYRSTAARAPAKNQWRYSLRTMTALDIEKVRSLRASRLAMRITTPDPRSLELKLIRDIQANRRLHRLSIREGK